MSQPVDELTYDECAELLCTQVVGRLAFQGPAGLRIVLVNYSLVGDHVVFRTAPYTELATHGPGREVAFEVDQLDPTTHRGWDVVVAGRLEVVDDPEEVLEIQRVENPEPWARGLRHLYLRLPITDLTGRRVGAAGEEALLDRPPDPSSGSAGRQPPGGELTR